MAKHYNLFLSTGKVPGSFFEKKSYNNVTLKEAERLIKLAHPNHQIQWEEEKGSLCFQPTMTTLYRLLPVQEDLPVIHKSRTSLKEFKLAYGCSI